MTRGRHGHVRVRPWRIARQVLTTSARVSGQLVRGRVHRQAVGLEAAYYVPQGRSWSFFAAASADLLTHPNEVETLQLGGDNGLRGYPLRYQSGTRRALFTLEERAYSDLYVFRLFHVGGAAFFDTGRAWAGPLAAGAGATGWISDVGVGLRIVSARSAFSNLLHVDLAVPLDRSGDIKRVQLLVKTRASF